MLHRDLILKVEQTDPKEEEEEEGGGRGEEHEEEEGRGKGEERKEARWIGHTVHISRKLALIVGIV